MYTVFLWKQFLYKSAKKIVNERIKKKKRRKKKNINSLIIINKLL